MAKLKVLETAVCGQVTCSRENYYLLDLKAQGLLDRNKFTFTGEKSKIEGESLWADREQVGMADEVDIALNARDLFGTVDLDGSGYIDREELAAVCDLDYDDLGEVFNQLDADRDGRISIEEFSENFKKFKNVVSGLKQKRLTRSATGDEIEELKQRLGKSFTHLSG